MLCTEDYCAIITALGGSLESLTDKTEKTLVNTIFSLINSGISGRTPKAAEVLTAIQGMNTTQKKAVKTALSVSPTAAEVVTAIEGMDETQKASVKTALDIT